VKIRSPKPETRNKSEIRISNSANPARPDSFWLSDLIPWRLFRFVLVKSCSTWMQLENRECTLMDANSRAFVSIRGFRYSLLVLARPVSLRPSKIACKMASISEPRNTRNTRKKDLFVRVFRVFRVFRGFFCSIWFWQCQVRISSFGFRI
jgi:hypothetical protein